MCTKKTRYIISFDNDGGYVEGGTFRFGGEKYAKLTKYRLSAKRYISLKRAEKVGRKLVNECCNTSRHFFIEEDDGYQSWKY